MTTKQTILSLLSHGRAIHKGIIEEEVRKLDGSMGDTCSRRLRELVNEGKLIKTKDSEGNTMYKVCLPVRVPESDLIHQNKLFATPAGRPRAYLV